MKATCLPSLILACAGTAFGQVTDFNALGGTNPDVSNPLDGYSVADQFGASQYSGYVGEMALIFAGQENWTGGTPEGTFIAEGTYQGKLGIVVFCMDSSTPFGESTSSAEIYRYQPHSLAAAESRYLSEGVNGYRAGGMKRAAYLIEQYYTTAHAGGDLEAAALQAAIWEVLTDETPSLSQGSGTYFLRSNTGNITLDQRSLDIIGLTDNWFAAAQAASWGGDAYDPGTRVAFWLDPENTQSNQSLISLNPAILGIQAVPEPDCLILSGAAVLLLWRRRRSVTNSGAPAV